MIKKTYQEIQNELTHKTKSNENLKKRVSSLKGELLHYKDVARSLPVQYERIIKEYRKTLDDVLQNGWKLLFIKIVEKKNKIFSK